MGRNATVCLAVWIGALLGCMPAAGEDWVRLGNSAIDFSLAGLATGPVERVWYGPGGDSLLIQTSSGKVFETKDFESWKASAATAAPAAGRSAIARLPEAGAKTRTAAGQSPASYAFGGYVYRSKDGGASWDNLTAARVPRRVGLTGRLRFERSGDLP